MNNCFVFYEISEEYFFEFFNFFKKKKKINV